MIDEAKRKKIIYITVGFLIFILISTIVWFVFFSKDKNLPPEEPVTNKTETSTPVAPSADEQDVTMFKNDIAFHNFDELTRIAITNSRIDLVQYYLAEYATSQPKGKVTSFTLDKPSIKGETKEDERFVLTFTVKDNTDTPYTVELMYASAADTYVRILDKNNTLVQSSPYDTD